ncbi:MAG TPA: acyl-protein synthetase, partial [Acidimicrobiia bacterium]|nr:acyl-protein synthetase [Acidimicrobiia bacterium]
VAAVPFVPVGIFKRRTLKSIADAEVFKTVTSSGTTGSMPSRVHLDRATAARQTKALAAIMQTILGPARRPMLIVDTDAVLSDRSSRSARAAGILGLMGLGRHHTFLLDAAMEPQPERLAMFVAQHAGSPLLVFGFTYMVWQHLYRPFAQSGIDLGGATVVHSGGWKQMEAERVDNATFKRALHDAFGVERVVNFYGMAEQVGSVFTEGDDGRLHPAAFSDVIVRDPRTWEALPPGREGVLQVVSAVPTSYPGHSILTEDLGVVDAVDDPVTPHLGKSFRVLGRIPKAELRGCSDTYASVRVA